MIKWGILGLGKAAISFANAIKEVENAKLIAIASLSKNKINSFQKNLIFRRVIVLIHIKT